MKKQDKYKPQMSISFFSDGRASRRPVEGTVSQRDRIAPTSPYATGVDADGTYVAPQSRTADQGRRSSDGQATFNIYCAPCHDRTGSGPRRRSARKATWVPGNLHDERIVNFVDGEIFHVISDGPALDARLPLPDSRKRPLGDCRLRARFAALLARHHERCPGRLYRPR